MAAKVLYGKLDIQGLKAAHGKFNKTLHKQMILLMKGAIREFAKVAATNVHVDTGMAAGSLQPLAKAAGGITVLVKEVCKKVLKPEKPHFQLILEQSNDHECFLDSI